MPTQKGNIANLLKDRQKIEDVAVANTSNLIEQTDNLLIKLVIRKIKQDSAIYNEAQQLIIDHFGKKSIAFNLDEKKQNILLEEIESIKSGMYS